MKRNLSPLSAFSLLVTIVFTLYSCQKDLEYESTKQDALSESLLHKQSEPGFADNTMVMYWNDKVNTVLTGGNQPSRTRYFAIIQIAVHDALNNIKPKYETYALHDRTQHASPDAAVAAAAYHAIIGLNRQGTFPVSTWYNESLASIADGESKSLGIELGKHAAEAIIANRANDGFSQTILTSLTPANGVNPGEYRSTVTAINWVPTNNQFGFRILHNWATVVQPWVANNNHQFRGPGPYSINSNEYTNDFNEVKNKGGRIGSTRTAEEDYAARFWLENRPSYFWNIIVRKAIENKKLDAWKTARLFALVHTAMADDMNAVFDGYYHYYYWRPETAVRLADSDGNSNTNAVADWLPGINENATSPTPPIPGYPSSFASFGGVTAEMLQLFFGTDNTSIDMVTTSLNPILSDPKPAYHFSSFSTMATGNTNATILNGWEFRKAAEDGESLGRNVAQFVFNNAFREN